ncbi:hypothetical protein E4H12_08075 [Candidatus Thorarchaeota archaeon]|nr:MAG: hypothetical protein E4H12_08075 [Candidatus Thorarchaeota archaeon]
MNKKVMIIHVSVIITLLSLIPSVQADFVVIDTSNDEKCMTPIAHGNLTTYRTREELAPVDMCVSENGITFTANENPFYGIIRSITDTSVTAWSNEGNILWSVESNSWNRLFYGITSDDSFVYVTGVDGNDPFLAKYDHEGNHIWNTTIGIPGSDKGLDIEVSEDGTIVVAGPMENSTFGYFLIALSSDGDTLWSNIFENQPSIDCANNYIYVACDGIIEKRTTDTNLVWSSPIAINVTILAREDSLYSIPFRDTGQRPRYINKSPSIDVTKWNSTTGDVVWTETVGIQNSTHSLYRWGGVAYTIDNKGNFTLLLEIKELSGWYQIIIGEEGEILSATKILDNTWQTAFIEYTEVGKIHVAGYGSSQLTISIFDPEYPNGLPVDGLDLSLIIIVTGIVVLFDVGLIHIFKKRKGNVS